MQGGTVPGITPVGGAFFKGLAADSGLGSTPPLRRVPTAAVRESPELLSPTPPRLPAPACGGGRPRIVFVLMSAVARAGTVDQLAHALAPHQVLVHHDFSQTPNFPLQAANVRFVPHPVPTGWGQFGFVRGIFHALQHALDTLDFDYLQLLSPSCLPIKPMAEFERHVSGMEEAHFDCLDLMGDTEVRRNVGYRAWTAEGSLMHRAMRRLCRLHYQGAQGRRNEAGIWLRSQSKPTVACGLSGLALDALAHPALGRHLREQPLHLYYGSTWFGARRHIVAGMLRTWRQPGVQAHFSRVRLAEEFLVPSLLMKTHAHKGPLHHLIQRFDEAHPGVFGLDDLAELRASPAFFARKFPDDPEAVVRLRVLRELAHWGTSPQAAPAALAAAA
jgi:hypothetical protein